MSKEREMSQAWGKALEDAQEYSPQEFYELVVKGGEIDPRRMAATVAILSSIMVVAILGIDAEVPPIGAMWYTHDAQLAQELIREMRAHRAALAQRDEQKVVA